MGEVPEFRFYEDDWGNVYRRARVGDEWRRFEQVKDGAWAYLRSDPASVRRIKAEEAEGLLSGQRGMPELDGVGEDVRSKWLYRGVVAGTLVAAWFVWD